VTEIVPNYRCCWNCDGAGSHRIGGIPDGFGGYRAFYYDCSVCAGTGRLRPHADQPWQADSVNT
jgi:hypothetical protein